MKRILTVKNVEALIIKYGLTEKLIVGSFATSTIKASSPYYAIVAAGGEFKWEQVLRSTYTLPHIQAETKQHVFYEDEILRLLEAERL